MKSQGSMSAAISSAWAFPQPSVSAPPRVDPAGGVSTPAAIAAGQRPQVPHLGARFHTTLSSLFLFRQAGLPTVALNALSSDKTTALFAKLAEQANLMGDLQQQLVTVLHDAVHKAAKDPDKQTEAHCLIDLKRCIHNRRAPKDSKGLRQAMDCLEPSQRAILESWLKAAASHQQAAAQLPAALEADLDQSRREMYRWCSLDVFRRGFQVANPNLDEKLDAFRPEVSPTLTRKHRIFDSTLFGYFLRACTKTSPFSTFGLIAHGSWRSATSPVESDCAPHGHATHARLNVAILARLSSWLTKQQLADGSLRLALNPTTRLSSTAAHFARPRSRPLSRMATFGAVNSQGMYTAPLSPHLLAIVNLLNERASLTAKRLVTELAEVRLLTAEDGKAFVEYLHEISLLVPHQTHDGADYESAFEHVKEQALAVGSVPILAFLTRVHRSLGGLDTPDHAARRGLLKDITASARALMEALPELQCDPVKSTLLYEDARIAGKRLVMDPHEHRDLSAALTGLQQLQPIFDVSAPLRVALTEYFKKRFDAGGMCADVPRLAEEFARECMAPFWSGSSDSKTLDLFDSTLGIAGNRNIQAVRTLKRLRNVCLRHLMRIGRASNCTHIFLENRDIDRIKQRMPVRIYETYSASFFAQECLLEKSLCGWVLNKVYGGSGQLMSRLLYLWEAEHPNPAETLVRDYLRAATPTDGLLVEITGNEDSNLNFHPTLVEHLLNTSTTSRTISARTPINVADLRIRHDRVSDTLSLLWEQANRKLYPVYLGGLVNQLLPDLEKTLLLFGPSAPVSLPTWQTLFAGEVRPGVHAFPRVSVGALVILRRTWCISEDVLTSLKNAKEPADFMTSLIKLRSTHALPDRAYVTFARPPSTNGEMEEANLRKPMYLDFDRPSCVVYLQRELDRHSGALWITEPLPDPAFSASQTDRQPTHHSEYVFDLTSCIEAETA